MKYAWIQEHVGMFPVIAMYKVLKVNTSGYYHWRNHTPSARELHHDASVMLLKGPTRPADTSMVTGKFMQTFVRKHLGLVI